MNCCENCIWWNRADYQAYKWSPRRCMVNPPTVIPNTSGGTNSQGVGGTHTEALTVWPLTAKDDGCGFWSFYNEGEVDA